MNSRTSELKRNGQLVKLVHNMITEETWPKMHKVGGVWCNWKKVRAGVEWDEWKMEDTQEWIPSPHTVAQALLQRVDHLSNYIDEDTARELICKTHASLCTRRPTVDKVNADIMETLVQYFCTDVSNVICSFLPIRGFSIEEFGTPRLHKYTTDENGFINYKYDQNGMYIPKDLYKETIYEYRSVMEVTAFTGDLNIKCNYILDQGQQDQFDVMVITSWAPPTITDPLFKALFRNKINKPNFVMVENDNGNMVKWNQRNNTSWAFEYCMTAIDRIHLPKNYISSIVCKFGRLIVDHRKLFRAGTYVDRIIHVLVDVAMTDTKFEVEAVRILRKGWPDRAAILLA